MTKPWIIQLKTVGDSSHSVYYLRTLNLRFPNSPNDSKPHNANKKLKLVLPPNTLACELLDALVTSLLDESALLFARLLLIAEELLSLELEATKLLLAEELLLSPSQSGQ